jgi:DnaJ-class molecular chaperone
VKNYYLILGVHRGESERVIRAAYRDLAKRFHPDRVGAGGTGHFQTIVEAYEVLSDPAKRRFHNEELDRTQLPPGWTDRVPPEPLLARREAESFFGSRAGVHPSFEALDERFLRNFTGIRVPKAEREAPLSIDVFLEPEEGGRGGRITIDVPVFRPCSACRGSGWDWLLPCPLCGGEGLTSGRAPIGVEFPPGVPSGTVVERSLVVAGVLNLYLRVRFLIKE